MFNFGTDLADERAEICKKNIKKNKIDGVEIYNKKHNDKIDITRVKVLNKNGEKKIREKSW